MSDLIERLRSVPKVWAGHVMHEDGIVPADGRIVHEAADEIERLTAGRDELRRQLAEAAESIARQAATIRGLTRPAEE